MLFILFDIEVALSISVAVRAKRVRQLRPRRGDPVLIVLLLSRRLVGGEGGRRMEVIRQRWSTRGDLRIRKACAPQDDARRAGGRGPSTEYARSGWADHVERAQNWELVNGAGPPPASGAPCCAIEMITTLAALARTSRSATRSPPRHPGSRNAICQRRISVKKMGRHQPHLRPRSRPSRVISMGACASERGMFNNYALVAGADKSAVDVYVPGCPSPEALGLRFMKLQRIIEQDPELGWRETLPGRRAPRSA